MGKYDYAPQTARLAPPLVLGACMGLTATLATNVHMRHDNIYSMVACTAAVVLLSNLGYAALTAAQCLCHTARATITAVTGRHGEAAARRRALADARPTPESGRSDELSAAVVGGLTGTALFTQTIDFARARAEIKLYVSREEVWRILYPLAAGFYVLFVCLPVYDATCTVCLSFGFFMQSTHDELRRGLHFRRPTARRILFCMMGISGMLTHCLAFVFVYIASVRATSEGWHAGRGFVDELEEFHALLYNISSDYLRSGGANVTAAAAVAVAGAGAEAVAVGGSAAVWAAANNSSMGLNASSAAAEGELVPYSASYRFADANVAQYLTWSAHAYPESMCMMWGVCLMGANLLRNAPSSVRLPVAIEIAQPAVSAVAVLVLCAASWWLDVPVFSLVDSQNALGDLYLLSSGGGVWLCVLMLTQGVRDRCSIYVACVVLVVVMAKTVAQHTSILRNHQTYELMVCTCVTLGIYVVCAVLFCRKENVAVRGGWGGSASGCSGGIDSDDDDGHSQLDSDDEIEMAIERAHPAPRHAVYSIEDVLSVAQDDIAASERVIATNKHKVRKSPKRRASAAVTAVGPIAATKDTGSTPDTDNAAPAAADQQDSDSGSDHDSAKTVVHTQN